MKLVASGVDPSNTRKTDRMASMARAEAARLADAGLPGRGTFEHVATEWLSTIHEAKVSEGHSARTRIRLVQDIFPWLGRRQIGEIEAPELLVCLRRVEARGAIETGPSDQRFLRAGVQVRNRDGSVLAQSCGGPSRRASASSESPPCGRH